MPLPMLGAFGHYSLSDFLDDLWPLIF